VSGSFGGLRVRHRDRKRRWRGSRRNTWRWRRLHRLVYVGRFDFFSGKQIRRKPWRAVGSIRLSRAGGHTYPDHGDSQHLYNVAFIYQAQNGINNQNCLLTPSGKRDFCITAGQCSHQELVRHQASLVGLIIMAHSRSGEMWIVRKNIGCMCSFASRTWLGNLGS